MKNKCKICGKTHSNYGLLGSICQSCLIEKYHEKKRKKYDAHRKRNKQREDERIAKFKETMKRKNEGIIIEPYEPFLTPKCRSCGKNNADHEHTCPFKVEINNDCVSMCNCCNSCRQECACDV